MNQSGANYRTSREYAARAWRSSPLIHASVRERVPEPRAVEPWTRGVQRLGEVAVRKSGGGLSARVTGVAGVAGAAPIRSAALAPDITASPGGEDVRGRRPRRGTLCRGSTWNSTPAPLRTIPREPALGGPGSPWAGVRRSVLRDRAAHTLHRAGTPRDAGRPGGHAGAPRPA